jgi:Right handed beta helix region
MNTRKLVIVMSMMIGAVSADETKRAAEKKCDADLCVGPARKLHNPSDAAAIAKDGQTIHIDAGDYIGDVAQWTQDGLTLRGAEGRAHMKAAGANYGGKGTWVIKGANTTVENLEFSGAQVPDRNGAGIRFEGKNLIVRNCYFHHNENGILGGTHDDGEVLVEHSEFAFNGFGDGQSHNIYIGRIRSLTVRFSYLHHAIVGHNLKSRARTNYVMYNRIVDESDGRASYEQHHSRLWRRRIAQSAARILFRE